MSTGYSSGMRRNRIVIQNRMRSMNGKFGLDSGGLEWQYAATVWAAVDWAKGMRTLNTGAIDAYGVVLVRMNWNRFITMRSRIVYDGKIYQILPETFHADKQANTIQFNAQAIISETN